jgi:hypothetical protein
MIRKKTPMTGRGALIFKPALPLFVLLACGFFTTAAAQAPSTNHDSPPASEPAAKQDSAQDKSTPDDSAAQKPAKPRKVITNDDIDAAHARAAQGIAGEQKAGDFIPATGACDEDCAREVRQQMGYGPEQEGEWQFQLVAARRNLAKDTRWRQVSYELNQAVQLYCGFMDQQRTAVLPSGNGWSAAQERAERQRYAENMGRTLSQKLSNATAATNRYIGETGQLEPVRAAMMNVLASRQVNSCSYLDP